MDQSLGLDSTWAGTTGLKYETGQKSDTGQHWTLEINGPESKSLLQKREKISILPTVFFNTSIYRNMIIFLFSF